MQKALWCNLSVEESWILNIPESSLGPQSSAPSLARQLDKDPGSAQPLVFMPFKDTHRN